MKKLIFALILIAVTNQIGIMIGQTEAPIMRSRLRELPGVSIASFLILGPELSASNAIQNLQPPQVADEEINRSLKNIHDAYVSLITQNLDRDTLAKAKQEIESLKLAGDAIMSPALKNYFLNLVSIARKKLHEVWENKETAENLDVILDADFTLDPLITIISKGVSSVPMMSTRLGAAALTPAQQAAEEQRMQTTTEEELTPEGTRVMPGIPLRPRGTLGIPPFNSTGYMNRLVPVR